MKKISLILVLLFALISVSNAQDWTLKKNSTSTLDKYGLYATVKGDTVVQAVRVMSDNRVKKDTLSGYQIKSFDFGGDAFMNEIELYNTAAFADTVDIYVKDSFGRWTQGMVTLIDLFTNLPLSSIDDYVIPANTTKRFRLSDQYCGEVKIQPNVATGQTGDIIAIAFIKK